MTNHTINVIRNYYGPKTTHTKYVDNQAISGPERVTPPQK